MNSHYAYLSILFEHPNHLQYIRQLWIYLGEHSSSKTCSKALEYFFSKLKHKEHYLYLYHAIALIIYQEYIPNDLLDDENENYNLDQLYIDHCQQEKLKLDDFVYDLHTQSKHQQDKTKREEFAREGAQVTNECHQLLNIKYRQMYQEFKIMLDQYETNSKKRKTTGVENNRKKKLPKVEEKIFPIDNVDNEIERLGYQLCIKDEDFVSNVINLLPHGQKRTSKHKKAVFVDVHSIYKGPYQATDVQLSRNLCFTKALIALENELDLPINFRSVLDWKCIIKIETDNVYYLNMKNIGKRILNVDEDCEKDITTLVEKNVTVIKRGQLVKRLSEIEKTNEVSDDVKQACIQHFYLRYLLNVGDSGTWNILIRQDENDRICGIDFEECRGRLNMATNDPFQLIMSKVSKRQRQLYKEYLIKIQIFNKPISETLATLLTSYKIDVNSVNERIEKYKKLISGQ